jgi:SAM-dependent methyltransferase
VSTTRPDIIERIDIGALSMFDAAVSTQVYEYVADVPAALAEVYRVLRPGGRVLILDTDWDSIVWAAGDQARMQRLLETWADRFADPHLPRSLAWQLQSAGFRVERREVLVLFNPEYDPDTYSVANGQIMADFAVTQGRMRREAKGATSSASTATCSWPPSGRKRPELLFTRQPPTIHGVLARAVVAAQVR